MIYYTHREQVSNLKEREDLTMMTNDLITEVKETTEKLHNMTAVYNSARDIEGFSGETIDRMFDDISEMLDSIRYILSDMQNIWLHMHTDIDPYSEDEDDKYDFYEYEEEHLMDYVTESGVISLMDTFVEYLDKETDIDIRNI
jgi:hypothetical protein